MEIPSKDVRHIIKATFPQYRRKSVFVNLATTVDVYGLNWDGGSRSEYACCTVTGAHGRTAHHANMPHPMNNPYENKKLTVPKGMVVVRGGTFMGKPALLRMYIRPDDLKVLLPDVVRRILAPGDCPNCEGGGCTFCLAD